MKNLKKANRRDLTKKKVCARLRQVKCSSMAVVNSKNLIGKCKKLSPFDCGIPQCPVCSRTRYRHSRKLENERIKKEIIDNENWPLGSM